MVDEPGKIKVAWSIGKGKIPNGPDFSNTTGTIDLDSFRCDQIYVSKKSEKTFLFDDTIMGHATILLIRAIPDDNGGADLYKKLSYLFVGKDETHPAEKTVFGERPFMHPADKTQFGEGPLMLIGSVAKLVKDYKGITISYDPDKGDNSTEGVAKATTPQPPKQATISILICFRTPPDPQPDLG